jgi:hypothetical protein
MKQQKENVKLNQLIRQLADRENQERDETTKKYTQDERESQEFERGFKEGWQAAKDKFWAEGFDAGLKQSAQEEKKDKEEEEEPWGKEKGIVREDEEEEKKEREEQEQWTDETNDITRDWNQR